MSKPVIAKLRRATVPSPCWKVDSASAGILDMSEWVANLKERRDSGEQVPNVYIQAKTHHAVPVAALRAQLYARQAVAVAGMQGRYMTFETLMQHLAWPPVTPMYDQAISSRCSPLEVQGSGFLAVTGIPLDAHEIDAGARVFQALAFLHEHVCEGGLLIATGRCTLSARKGIDEFSALLFDTSSAYEV